MSRAEIERMDREAFLIPVLTHLLYFILYLHKISKITGSLQEFVGNSSYPRKHFSLFDVGFSPPISFSIPRKFLIYFIRNL